MVFLLFKYLNFFYQYHFTITPNTLSTYLQMMYIINGNNLDFYYFVYNMLLIFVLDLLFTISFRQNFHQFKKH